MVLKYTDRGALHVFPFDALGNQPARVSRQFDGAIAVKVQQHNNDSRSHGMDTFHHVQCFAPFPSISDVERSAADILKGHSHIE